MLTTLKMAGSQWSYRRKVQQDALGEVNRVKEIRRRRKDGLKINRYQLFVRQKVSRVVGEGVVMDRVGGKWEAVVFPTTSQILGPPGSWLLLGKSLHQWVWHHQKCQCSYWTYDAECHNGHDQPHHVQMNSIFFYFQSTWCLILQQYLNCVITLFCIETGIQNIKFGCHFLVNKTIFIISNV